MTYMVYPGATHKRFEHSLGVMELAGRAFDAITAVDNVDEQTRVLFPEITYEQFCMYWRKVLRLAALCHDLEFRLYAIDPVVKSPFIIS
jgi:HD superfamily phosphohydrolase